ncbi:hypothetical protein ASG29_04920 [Sphingomonas sp. Leaf412]|uniref:hypothetical protein n=1 Tax=Sphingomonas sp. Leaf412 TaxID=1736370 RepID=UPI000701EE04|nr:hypothetical protein [Sphingomonas sp. Leaf412]KQT33401.1 hypothetical protein ASG29_04920 [Sphingomonas sp. Leaf412]
MTRMTIDPMASEIAWALLALGITALVFAGAAWSYPQGRETIWTVGAATMVAVALLSARDVRRVRHD